MRNMVADERLTRPTREAQDPAEVRETTAEDSLLDPRTTTPPRHRRRPPSHDDEVEAEYQPIRRRTDNPLKDSTEAFIEPTTVPQMSRTLDGNRPKVDSTRTATMLPQLKRRYIEPTRSQPPAPLVTFNGENVLSWLEDVHDVVFGIWKLTESDWLSRLTTHLGPQPKEFYRTKLRGQPWSSVSQAFKDAYNSPLQQARLLHELENVRQQPQENFAIFVERARVLARRIDPNMQERELRSHIKKGIRELEFQKEFIKGSLKSLDVLCEEISMLEAVEFETTRLRSTGKKPIFQVSETDYSDSDQMFQLQQPTQQLVPTDPFNSHAQSANKRTFLAGMFCNYCKKEGHIIADCNKRKVCSNCGGRYHLAPECKRPSVLQPSPLTGSNTIPQRNEIRTGKIQQPNPLPLPPTNRGDVHPLHHIKSSTSTYAMHVTTTINGTITEALLDTGSSVSTCHPDLLLPGQLVTKDPITPLIVANEELILPVGTADVTIHIAEEPVGFTFRVTSAIPTRMILGRDFLKEHVRSIHLQDDYIELKSGTRLPCWRSREQFHGVYEINPCYALEDVSIPPVSTALVRFRPRDLPQEQTLGTVEALQATNVDHKTQAKSSRMEVVPSLIDLSAPNEFVAMVKNNSIEPLRLRCGEKFGQFIPAGITPTLTNVVITVPRYNQPRESQPSQALTETLDDSRREDKCEESRPSQYNSPMGDQPSNPSNLKEGPEQFRSTDLQPLELTNSRTHELTNSRTHELTNSRTHEQPNSRSHKLPISRNPNLPTS